MNNPRDTLASYPHSKTARLTALLAWCVSVPRGRDMAIALLLTLPLPLLIAVMPVMVINYAHHDIFVPLDAAWRTLQGQWPHTDVYSPLGVAYFWMHGAAAWLWGMDGRVVVRANLIAFPFVMLPAFLFAWRRLNVFSVIAATVTLTVLVMAPTFIDGPPRVIAALASYNRIGSALCAVVCLWALCPPRMASRGLAIVEAVAIGVILLILLYLKVTFFTLALATVLAGCCSMRGVWPGAIIAVALVILGALALELLHPGLLQAYIADLRRAGAANPRIIRFYVSQIVLPNMLPGTLVAVLAAIAFWVAPARWWAITCILAVAGACLLVSTQNFGAFSPPLIMLVIVLAQRLAAGSATAPEAGAPAIAIAGLLAVALAAVPFVATQASGAAYQLVANRAKGVIVGEGRSASLGTVLWEENPIDAAYVPEDFTPELAVQWHAALPFTVANDILTDGLDLLRRDGLTGRRIANLSFSNPFPVAFKAPPPHGVALWWDVDRTFRAGRLSPDLVLGDADVVMVAKVWFDYTDVEALFDVARTRLEQDFVPHQSKYWTAWVKK